MIYFLLKITPRTNLYSTEISKPKLSTSALNQLLALLFPMQSPSKLVLHGGWLAKDTPIDQHPGAEVGSKGLLCGELVEGDEVLVVRTIMVGCCMLRLCFDEYCKGAVRTSDGWWTESFVWMTLRGWRVMSNNCWAAIRVTRRITSSVTEVRRQ